MAECVCFVTTLIFFYPTHFETMVSLWAAITSKWRLRHPNQILFLSPQCVRIPWVLAPKSFPVEKFRVGSVPPTNSLFHHFLCPDGEKARYPRFVSTKIGHFNVCFFTKPIFLAKHFLLKACTHFLKAIGLRVNLGTLYVHPVTRFL